ANHTFSNRSIQKVSLFFDKLLGKSDNNAFVRVTIHVPKGKSIEDTTSHLFAFIRDLYPELRRFFL
ncbi:MAG: exosortase-associated EpsI family protein, partial [Spirochaetota bacterium]|nr:exosortase-associated EpsI family protein [Spirochaetota bacterium]